MLMNKILSSVSCSSNSFCYRDPISLPKDVWWHCLSFLSGPDLLQLETCSSQHLKDVYDYDLHRTWQTQTPAPHHYQQAFASAHSRPLALLLRHHDFNPTDPNIGFHGLFHNTILSSQTLDALLIKTLLLFSRGIPLDQQDNHGRTPLMVACQYPQLFPLVTTLIGLGADIHRHDRRDENALFHALSAHHLKAARTLLQLGIRPHHHNIQGKTCLNIAIQYLDTEQVALLCHKRPPTSDIFNDMRWLNYEIKRIQSRRYKYGDHRDRLHRLYSVLDILKPHLSLCHRLSL